eukprot:TRINITY_DN2345_c0_g2_i1.p1 TRINITY_DN2345_c0_g2~~TRINITY_DN2345_c0_g2_i1.p1  ORF type:complete len:199 (-),score=34.76 TRINITY_DN2345_c0_g2_i1:315-911(-)
MKVRNVLMECQSCTLLIGGAGVILWVMRCCERPSSAAAPLDKSGTTSVPSTGQADSTPRGGSPRLTPTLTTDMAIASGPPSSEGYPDAAAYPDPLSKIVSQTGPVNGRGRRPTLMLWQKYGQKTVFCSDKGERSRVVERMYYKCYSQGCKARLKIDLEQGTGHRVSINPSGKHDHRVVVVQHMNSMETGATTAGCNSN